MQKSAKTCERASGNNEALASANVGGNGSTPVDVYAPPSYGLLVTLDSAGTCLLRFAPDAEYLTQHPHVYGPEGLRDVAVLAGGGSGVVVFGGSHPDFGGDLVMKNGSVNETVETFALAKVSRELVRRGVTRSAEAGDAAKTLRDRIPEFRSIYVSPRHLRDRGKLLWSILRRGLIDGGNIRLSSLYRNPKKPPPTFSGGDRRQKGGRQIQLRVGGVLDDDLEVIQVHQGFVLIHLGPNSTVLEGGTAVQLGAAGDGYDALSELVDNLMVLQEDEQFKYTLAQKRIGGSQSPLTAAALLVGCKLEGLLLEKLLNEFVVVIRDLQTLTLENEVNVLDQLQDELNEIESQEAFHPEDISELIDEFMGFAITKNFHPFEGRFPMLRQFGETLLLRQGVFLTEREELPARHLSKLLQRRVQMSNVFVFSPNTEGTALDVLEDSWRDIIRLTSGLKCAAARDRIWNGGLADSGLHNMFLSEQIWLFDLGEPSLQPLPAMLTKFLFSFFHTLGMEERADESAAGVWVRRFELSSDDDERLVLTKETANILPKVYGAFDTAVSHLLEVFFDGEKAVREVLVRYVLLQLLSDAAFCVSRWKFYGGGSKREADDDQKMEKWLWRALWDLYIATDAMSKLLTTDIVPHPLQ